jgi:hypothetical protein
VHEFPLVSVSQLSVRVPPTSGKPLLEQIPRQNNEVQFIDHAVTILLGTNVTKRSAFSCRSTNRRSTLHICNSTAAIAPYLLAPFASAL